MPSNTTCLSLVWFLFCVSLLLLRCQATGLSTRPARSNLTTLALAKRAHSDKGLPPGWARCTLTMDERVVVAAFDATKPESTLIEFAQELTDAFYLETMSPIALQVVTQHILQARTAAISQPDIAVDDRETDEYLPPAEERATDSKHQQEHLHLTLIFQAQWVFRDWLVDILGPPDTNQTNVSEINST